MFTTNYDRFIEYGFDSAGILYLDRFVGSLNPKFRETKLNYDYHYNPPGIRGEPRYVEGVVKYSKLHGSVDWKSSNQDVIKKLLPFGADEDHPEIGSDLTDSLLIYPNSSKGIETAFYPYSELFREFSTAICRPNSSLVTYGYGFGDSHINSIIEDMLSIPSTHLVVISYDGNERIKSFFENQNPSQFTLLLGKEFGDLEKLNKYYLPKSAIDRISIRRANLLKNRGEEPSEDGRLEQENGVSNTGEEE
ncbi:SIR2 family protein [Aliifodinibius sp. S!AR15-10]|uniref:SIR2 family protein n=1 Tax=Aliifodinibius sp. S!AR15-10 TaxID=2950437 RepID=UPI00286675D4|nr:SIR2 family protein [Aliifodinibius sp. S!AR15-10]MDR8391147.1 SIR2 family protein [Aliifodinibius sp. S!AR15-10]